MGCTGSRHAAVQDQETHKQAASPHGSIRTDTAMPLASSANGTSPFSNHLQRMSTPSYRLQHEYRGSMKPHDELDRISTLQSLDILDTKPEPKYDDITKLLCSIFNMPIAQLSLVDSDRQWCKSIQGHDMREIDRNLAFCAWVLLPKHPKALIVEDTLLDARFRDSSLVTGHPYIRFYAGAPLIASNGHRLGSLCVIDTEPRSMDTEQMALLCNFAEMAVREMEKDKLCTLQRGNSLAAEMTADGMHRAVKALTEGLFVIDVMSPGWKILLMNEQAEDFAGVNRQQAQGQAIWSIFQLPSGHGRPEELYAHPIRENLEFSLVAIGIAQQRRLSLTFRAASSDMMDEHMPSIGIPNFVDFMRRKTKSFYFCFVTTMEKGPMPAASPAGTSLIEPSHTKDLTPFQDVRLGPLVGKGSFGKVYRGIWKDTIVAIKVIEHVEELRAVREPAALGHAPSLDQNGISAGTMGHPGADQPLLEAVLGHGLQHANVVETYKYATRRAEMRSEPFADRQSDLPQSLPPEDRNGQADFRDGCSSFRSEGTVLSCGGGKHMQETWLLLEYCDKGSLQDGIEQGWFRRPPIKTAPVAAPDLGSILLTAQEIAAALAYLHSLDVLHGDLTGSNILLTSSCKDSRAFTVKVADFGLSRQAESQTVDTDTYGTVTHMPPELLMEGKLTKSADVYAFGVLLWEMYTGEKPFAGMRHAQIIYHVTTLLAHPQFPADTPPQLKELGDRCMHFDKDKRPTFSQLLPSLEQLELDLGIHKEQAIPAPSPAPTPVSSAP
ncbi:hypothetical protein ABBQ32_006391 [Trebouxia sp. C0010 RCD-2024]